MIELLVTVRDCLADETFFFRSEQFGEARIFLQESKILVVARMEAVFRAQLNGDFEIRQRGIRFTRKAIERGESVVDVVRFRRSFAGLVETFSSIIPAADVHHGDATFIMGFGRARILLMRRIHALIGNFHVHARAVGELFAGTFQNFFEFLFGFGKFLLMEKNESLIVDFQLGLDARVDELDAASLNRRRLR